MMIEFETIIHYWMGKAYEDTVQYEHGSSKTLNSEELMSMILFFTDKGYYVMLKNNYGVYTLIVDDKRFTQR